MYQQSMETLEIVSTEDLERELNEVREATGGSLSGIFGPQSVTWQVNREAAVFLGAGRALLLQLAHPWVATAIEQHSDTFADPIGRFHRTFSVMFTLVFGTLDQSLGAARRLHRGHAAIRGTLRSTAGPLSRCGPMDTSQSFPPMRPCSPGTRCPVSPPLITARCIS
jgi:ER-bound oxygenase mpaB/B'/Rubber oxygenase, catalytic domain